MEEEIKPEAEVKADDMISRAADAAKRLEEANIATEELVRRQEELAARNLLGGKSQAGETKEEEKELSPREYADKIFKGEINPLKNE